MSMRPIWITIGLLAACRSAAPEPTESERAAPEKTTPTPAATTTASDTPSATATATATATTVTGADGRPHRKVSAKPVKDVPVSPDDPLAGKFGLADAVKGLPDQGVLTAEIKTELGTLNCELYDDKAPLTVANFIGLARGLRPFKDADGAWVKKPGYDGTTFHRVVKGFMIQGGDPKGTGAGEPGYVIPDEIWEDAYHDRRGQLCMANRGPNTNGMQFFITDGAPAHLDGGYTIFGQCKPDDVIEKLASVETRGDKSLKPTKILKVTIKRTAKKAAPAAAPSH
jgi:peptidyl-prolyl cis-trans isomerase A (cyclophilin A)